MAYRVVLAILLLGLVKSNVAIRLRRQGPPPPAPTVVALQSQVPDTGQGALQTSGATQDAALLTSDPAAAEVINLNDALADLSSIPIPDSLPFYNGSDVALDGCPRDEVTVSGTCHQVLTQGPCTVEEQVLLDAQTLVGYCAPRLCSPDRIFVFTDQLCHDPRSSGLCFGGRELFQTAFGTPVCQCPDGTYEVTMGGCELLLAPSPHCSPRQVLWFRDFTSPQECVSDPCGGLNLRRTPSDQPFLPSRADGACHQLGQGGGGTCQQPDTYYSLSLDTLDGVCSRLEDAGYLVLDKQMMATFEALYGPFIPKDTATVSSDPLTDLLATPMDMAVNLANMPLRSQDMSMKLVDKSTTPVDIAAIPGDIFTGSMGMSSGSMGMPTGSMGMPTGSMGMPTGSMGMSTGSMSKSTGSEGIPTMPVDMSQGQQDSGFRPFRLETGERGSSGQGGSRGAYLHFPPHSRRPPTATRGFSIGKPALNFERVIQLVRHQMFRRRGGNRPTFTSAREEDRDASSINSREVGDHDLNSSSEEPTEALVANYQVSGQHFTFRNAIPGKLRAKATLRGGATHNLDTRRLHHALLAAHRAEGRRDPRFYRTIMHLLARHLKPATHHNRHTRTSRQRVRGSRRKRMVQTFHAAENVFDIRLLSCRSGAKRDINAKCRSSILPAHSPFQVFEPDFSNTIANRLGKAAVELGRADAAGVSNVDVNRTGGVRRVELDRARGKTADMGFTERGVSLTTPVSPKLLCPQGETYNVKRGCEVVRSVVSTTNAIHT